MDTFYESAAEADYLKMLADEDITYTIMHGDDIVAESLDGTFTEWKVYNENLMPYGLKIYDIQQRVDEALEKHGYKLQDMSKVQEWLSIRDKERDKVRDWNNIRITTWLSRRVLPLSRENAKIIYQHLGLEQHRTDTDRAKIAERFNGVSITDNYWIKKSTDNKKWADIDVKRISLSEGFGIIALSGESAATLSSIDDLTDKQAAAETGVVGTFPKGCFRKEGKLYIIKGGSEHSVIAEWLSSRILSCTNVYGYCNYELDDGTGRNGFPATGILSTYCEVMSNTNRDLIMASNIFSNAEEIAVNQFRQQYAQIAVIDYLIGNPDRHSGNWGFFSEAPDWKFTRLHDIYDNNKAFGQLTYYERGCDLKLSIVGRGTEKQKTLEEGAMIFKDDADLKFIKPVRKEWFYKLGQGWERYYNEFKRRCNKIGLDIQYE